MDWLTDWLRDVSLWLLAALGSALAVLFRYHYQLAARVAMLEKSVDDIPGDLEEIKHAVAEMRREGRERAKALYAHIDAVRKELKSDMRDGDQR